MASNKTVSQKAARRKMGILNLQKKGMNVSSWEGRGVRVRHKMETRHQRLFFEARIM